MTASVDSKLPTSPRWAFLVVVVLVPALQVLQSLVALYRVPAFWRFYADPPYMYLFNSLSLATGLTPQHVDHPGTSLQWLMAGIERATFTVSGNRGSLADDIAWNPEKYLNVTGVALAILFAASVTFFSWQLLRSVGAFPALIAGLLILSGSGLTVPWIVTATPEALVASVVLGILGILVPTLVNRSSQPSLQQLVALGALFAIGFTAKVIILPLVVLFIFALKIRGLVIAAGSAIVMSLLVLIPVLELLPRMLGWFANLAGSSGRYGGDSPSSVTSNIQSGLLIVTREYSLTWLALAAFAVALVIGIRNAGVGAIWPDRLPMLGLTASIAATLAVSFKETTDRDFILLVGLVPALAGLTSAWMQQFAVPMRLRKSRLLRALQGSVLVVLTLTAAAFNLRSFNEIRKIEERSDREVATLEFASEQDGVVVHSFLAQNEYFALMLGSEWAYHPYSSRIIARFPDNLYYNAFLSTIFGKRSDDSIGYLDCSDLNPLVQLRGLFFVLPGDFGPSGDHETPGQITLADGSVLEFDPTAVEVFDKRLSAIEIDACIPSE